MRGCNYRSHGASMSAPVQALLCNFCSWFSPALLLPTWHFQGEIHAYLRSRSLYSVDKHESNCWQNSRRIITVLFHLAHNLRLVLYQSFQGEALYIARRLGRQCNSIRCWIREFRKRGIEVQIDGISGEILRIMNSIRESGYRSSTKIPECETSNEYHNLLQVG